MSDRRVLAVSAACITAAIFLFLLGTYPSWKSAVSDALSWRSDAPVTPLATPTRPAETKRSDLFPAVPASQAKPSAVAAVQSPAAAMPTAKLAMAPASAPPSPAPQDGTPSFDIVRVEPSGDSVIAARTAPGATVVLLDQGHPIARAKADASGQVAFLPPPLSPGEHSLMLSLGEPDAPGALSSQSVAVSVPDRAKAPPMVALLQPDQPTKILSAGVSSGPGGASAAAPPVSVGAIDVEEMGSVFATGHATPGSQCRVYLNGSFVAGVTAGADGSWSLKIERGMRPGHYSVRIDELASASGDVRARAEVPFDYPARATASLSLLRPRKGQAASAVPAPGALAQRPSDAAAAPTSRVTAPPGSTEAITSAAATPNVPPAAGVPTIVAQLLTTKVVHGDSLWRISRKILGHGRRYTQIYAANTTQIRDPKLIYPGQIFVMPQTAP